MKSFFFFVPGERRFVAGVRLKYPRDTCGRGLKFLQANATAIRA